jgi:hypothetical protein
MEMKKTSSAATSHESSGIPADADAQRALAWLDRGKPQAEIVYDASTPRQSRADLAGFRPASYRRSHLPAPFAEEIDGVRLQFTPIEKAGALVRWAVVRSNRPPTVQEVVSVRVNAKPATIVARYLEASNA